MVWRATFFFSPISRCCRISFFFFRNSTVDRQMNENSVSEMRLRCQTNHINFRQIEVCLIQIRFTFRHRSSLIPYSCSPFHIGAVYALRCMNERVRVRAQSPTRVSNRIQQEEPWLVRAALKFIWCNTDGSAECLRVCCMVHQMFLFRVICPSLSAHTKCSACHKQCSSQLCA